MKGKYVSSNSAVEELYRHFFFSLFIYIYIYIYSEISGSKTCQYGVNTLENFHVLSWFQTLYWRKLVSYEKDFGFLCGYINILIKTG